MWVYTVCENKAWKPSKALCYTVCLLPVTLGGILYFALVNRILGDKINACVFGYVFLHLHLNQEITPSSCCSTNLNESHKEDQNVACSAELSPAEISS